MADVDLIVTAEDVGNRLGLETLTAQQRSWIEDAIEDAMDAVEGHLCRPLTPTEVTRAGLYPRAGAPLTSWEAWGADLFDDDYTVKEAVQQEDGSYTVTFLVGLDARTVRPILRYVRAHAAEAVRLNPGMQVGQRVITSMSADGQSLSFEASRPSGDNAGALPTLASLNGFVRRSAYQASRPSAPPWPMTSAPVGWDPR